MDGPDGIARGIEQSWYRFQMAFSDEYRRVLHGQFAGASHRNSNIGRRQRHRIIDPIANHHRSRSLAPQLTEPLHLLLRTQSTMASDQLDTAGRQRIGYLLNLRRIISREYR
jgi:hypothetical protein